MKKSLNLGINMIKPLRWIILLSHLLISIFILTPYFYTSVKQSCEIRDLSDEQRKEKIYRNFYLSMKDYISQIPDGVNAVIIEPPKEKAQFFWILNYYFLPRRIYTFPKYFLLDKELFDTLRIRFILIPQKAGFYFKKYHPSVPKISLISPQNNDTITSPPLFKWLTTDSGNYQIHICDEVREKLNIKCYNQYLFPYDIWERIPSKSRIYWYVEGINNHKFSRLYSFYKK